MAPGYLLTRASDPAVPRINETSRFGDWRAAADPSGFVTEGWGEGFALGSLMIMACITVANMRKGVFLHKLILLEVPFDSQPL